TLPEEGSKGLFDDGQFQKILEGPEGPRKAIGINREIWPKEGFSLNVGIHLSATPIPTLPDTTLRLLGDLVKAAASSVDPNAKHFKVAKPEDLNGLDTLTQSSFGNLEILPFDKLRNPDSMKQVEDGSLIVSTRVSPHIRAAYYVRSGQGEPGLLIESNMVTLLPDHSKVNPEWLLHALDTDWALEHLNNRASGNYGRFIWMRDLLTVPVLLPSLSDQASALNRLKRERFGLLSENEKLERDLITRRKREKLFLRARTHTIAQQFNGLKSDLSVLRKALKRHGQLDASAKPIPQDPTSVSQLVDLIYSECLELGEGIRRLSEPTLSHPRKEFILEEEVKAWVSRQKYPEVDIIYVPPRSQFNAEENDATPITISSSSPDDLNTILTNFVENAIRHGFRDPAVAQKKVELSLVYESTIEDGPFVILRVANNGTPLPDSFTLEHFTAPGLATGKTGNSGLGGWIIQELVNEAGAELTICNANLLLKEDLTTGFKIKFNFH
ncbi:hypothetical protein N9A78_03510, partial [Akkermansiaceae bacterium]|nr:hypothetical protein [Akkermansiaceae bacterium]